MSFHFILSIRWLGPSQQLKRVLHNMNQGYHGLQIRDILLFQRDSNFVFVQEHIRNAILYRKPTAGLWTNQCALDETNF